MPMKKNILPTNQSTLNKINRHYKEATKVEKVLQQEYAHLFRSALRDFKKVVKDYNGDFDAINRHILFNPTDNVKTQIISRIDNRTMSILEKEEDAIESLLMKLFIDNYSMTFFEIQNNIGYELEYFTLSEDRVRDITNAAWTRDKKGFVSRLERNNKLLADDLSEVISEGVAKGRDSIQMAHRLNRTTGAGFYNSQRIIRTETARVIAESDAKLYKDLDFEEYRYNATFDSRTSKACGDLDNSTFRLEEIQIGVNAPPMHPNCRSTIDAVNMIDYQPPYKYGKDGVGKPIKIPKGLTYEDWKKKYL